MLSFVRRVALFFEDHRRFSLAAIAIWLLGTLLRFVWLFKGDRLGTTNSEMFYVARAFAETGVLADAYGPGSGPTAHVTPAMPLMAGAIYRLLGVGTPQAELVLIVIALGFMGLTIWALDRMMAMLGSPAAVRLAAMAAYWLVPLNFSQEMETFRVWEGAAAACGMALVLLAVMRLDARSKPPSWLSLGGLSLAGGLMALVNPPAALAIYGCVGLLAWRRKGFLAFPAVAALSAVLLVLVSYPWAERNAAIFGERVWSRTNFGFNFALGFHDGKISPADPRKAFVDRLAEVDPFTSPEALAQLKAVGGEQAYSKYWTERTTEWVRAHPAASARIALQHVVDYYLPPRWLWFVYSDKAQGARFQQPIMWVLAILGFAAVAVRLAGRDWRYLYILAMLTLPAAPYLLAQPILRYRYVVTALLAYLAAEFVYRLLARPLGLENLHIVKAPAVEAAPMET